jgi:ubiquitin C-terminal hydrolase
MDEEEYECKDLTHFTDDEYLKNSTSGLKNLGFTCFLNTAIQCLSHTDRLTSYLVKNPNLTTTPEAQLLEGYINVLLALWQDDCIVSIDSFYREFSAQFPDHVPNSENDVAETVAFLLDRFNEILGQPNKAPVLQQPESHHDLLKQRADEAWVTMQKKVSIITDLFVGVEHHRNQCVKCHKVNNSFTPFNMLCLDFPAQAPESTDLFHLLAFYCRRDQLDSDNMLKCGKCDQYNQSYKKSVIWRLPQYLIITLKRFDNQARKIYSAVDYPITGLDMAPFVSKKSENQSILYDLYAVAMHIGISTQNGHYNCACMLPDKTWAQFDDRDVKTIDPSQALQPRKAYMLFYKQRGL